MLRSDGSVSERTRSALRRVQESGREVVIVSARAPDWLRPIAADLGLDGYALCCNGAVVYELARERLVRHHTLAAEVAERVVQALREAAPGVAFACERESIAIREPEYVPLWAWPDLHPRTDALEFVRDPVSKLVVQHPELSQVELYELAARLCGDDATVTYSGQRLVEISGAGVTKALALAGVCADLGVDQADVLAFGDMPNDVPMLAWAGRSVAVANAHPEALAAADEVTASNDEDGVALVLERL